MSTAIGVDWASGTWVVVEATDSETHVETQPSLLNVWHEYGDDADRILIDIPVHLSDDGNRECDGAAKEYLESRGSTVFWTPTRQAVEADSYESARDANSGGLGSQSWGLIPRIREVQALLAEFDDAASICLESHPEVCYRAFSGDTLPSKKEDAGIEARVELLDKYGGDSFASVTDLVNERQRESEWHHRIQAGRIDDVLDAAVLALTGREIDDVAPTLPADVDPTSEPAIVYPGDDRPLSDH